MRELDPDRREELLQRAAAHGVRPEDVEIIRAALASYHQLAQWVWEEGMTADRLRELVFGTGPEATPAASDERHERKHDTETNAT